MDWELYPVFQPTVSLCCLIRRQAGRQQSHFGIVDRLAQQITQALKDNPDWSHVTMAQQLGVSRSRVTQYLALPRLPEEIVEFMTNSDNEPKATQVGESDLRKLLRLDSDTMRINQFNAWVDST